jgi:hypothetical protein
MVTSKMLPKITKLFRYNQQVIEQVIKNVEHEHFVEVLEFMRFMLSKQAVDINIILLKLAKDGEQEADRTSDATQQSVVSDGGTTTNGRRRYTKRKK